MTVEAFLAWESGDDCVWELIDGFPQPKHPPNPDFHGQAAPSDAHVLIVGNIHGVVDSRLLTQRRRCHAFPGSGQTVPGRRDRHRIPDLVVKCGTGPWATADPILIVEVVSPSNTRADLVGLELPLRTVYRDVLDSR